MKKQIFKFLTYFLVFEFLISIFSIKSYAQPKVMADGQIFDAEFYADTYPDVVNAFGKSESALYRHYVKYGKSEGRLPYKDATLQDNVILPTPFAINKCLLMIGDSRTCGLITALAADPEFVNLYQYSKGKIYDAIYQKGDLLIVFCAEGGGRFCEGAYTRSVDRLLKIFDDNALVKSAAEYVAINMYGYNDIKVPAGDFTWPTMYIASDENLKIRLGDKCRKFYQFNSGPINEGGLAFVIDGISNEMIRQYNKSYVRTKNISVVDFYGYLIRKGYASNNIEDAEGVHYDYETNLKIWRLIFSLI